MEANEIFLLTSISNPQNGHDCMVLDKSGKNELQQCGSNAFSGDIDLESKNSDYICSCCHKSFKTFWGIQRHIRTNHQPEESHCTSQLTAKQPSLQSTVLLKQESEHRLLRRELVRKETNELTFSTSKFSDFREIDIFEKLTAESSDKIMTNLDKCDCSSSNIPEISCEHKVTDNGLKFPYQPKNSTECLCDLSDVEFGTCQSLHHHHKKSNPCLKNCQIDQDKRLFCLRKRICLSRNSNNDSKPVVINGRVLLCSWCQKTYLNYTELRNHQQIQHSIKGFPCFLCGLTFASRGRVAVHKMKRHRKCVCSRCQTSVSGVIAFAKHIELCNSGILTLEDGNREIDVTGDLQSEVVDENVTENSHVCDRCGIVLNTEVNLRIHRKLHNLKSQIHKTVKVYSLDGSKSINSGLDLLKMFVDQKEELQSKTKENCLCPESHDVTKPRLTSRTLFICEHCNMTFLSDLELKKHSHNCSRKLFNCDQCKFSFATVREQIVHRRKYHRKHKCNQCNVIFKGQIAFAKHIRSLHSGIPVYKANEKSRYYCDTCNRYFVTSNSLLLHYKRLHTMTKYKTCLTDWSSEGKRNNSSLESAYTCFWCSKEYPSYVELRKHRALEHRLKPFSCSDCRMTFDSQNAQITHRLKFHRKRRCNLCQASVCGTVAFNEHVRSCHPGMSVAKVNSRQLVCEYCSAIFDHEKRLNDHIQTRHLGFVHTCKVCSKTLKTEETLRIHLRLHNIETYKTCEFCGKQYPRLPGLMAHMRSKHPDNVPEKYRISFSCLHCGTNFTRSTTLRRHIETMHEGKKFACDICGKTFRNGRYVLQHKKTHHFRGVGSNENAIE